MRAEASATLSGSKAPLVVVTRWSCAKIVKVDLTVRTDAARHEQKSNTDCLAGILRIRRGGYLGIRRTYESQVGLHPTDLGERVELPFFLASCRGAVEKRRGSVEITDGDS